MIALTVSGIGPTIARLQGLSGVALAAKTSTYLGRVARSVVVPIVRSQTPVGKSRHGGDYPHDRGNLRASVVARKARSRPGEMAAYLVGPSKKRGYYRYMVTGGTTPHIITPRGLAGGAVSSAIRRVNRNGTGAQALSIGGNLVALVQHPGARPNPFVERAAHLIPEGGIAAGLGKELLR